MKRRTLIGELLSRYVDHTVGRCSAALTYYFIFSIWPFIIFISTLLGSLDLNLINIDDFAHIIPAEIIEIVNSYIIHVSETSSPLLLIFGLVFTVYFVLRAVNCLVLSITAAFGIENNGNFFAFQLRLLLMTLITVAALAATLVIVAAGPTVLVFLVRYMPFLSRVAELWIALRFVLLAALLFIMISAFYAIAIGFRTRMHHIMPGTITSLAAWMLLSIAFSYYVENVAAYSLLYGSVGTVIVMLLWLYLSSMMLIMGAELSAALEQRRKSRHIEDTASE